MASGTTVGGESARYCDRSISSSFYDPEQSLSQSGVRGDIDDWCPCVNGGIAVKRLSWWYTG